MKKLVLAFLLGSSYAFAGGIIGGNPGLTQEDFANLASFAFNIQSLPKAYTDADAFRRAKARLSESGVTSVQMSIDGESINVRTLRDSIVDDKISKEILPQ